MLKKIQNKIGSNQLFRNSILKFKPVIVCENGHNHISLLDFLNYKSVDQSYSDTFFVPVDYL